MTINLDRCFPRITEQAIVPIWCVTPDIDGCIHRFYDSSPISPSGRYLALTKLPYEDRPPSPGDLADIVVVDLANGAARTVATTRGWDMQLGAQPQWGHDDSALFFNDVDPNEWMPFGVRLDPSTGQRLRLGGTVYAVSPDGRVAASPCLRRMARTQRGYGVVVPNDRLPVNWGGEPREDDGIYVTDTETGACSLLVSLAEIAREGGLCGEGDVRPIYAFHVKWSPDGKRLMCVVRRWGEKDARDSSVVTMRADGSEIRCAITWKAGEGHHPHWCADSRSILMNLKVDGTMRFVRFEHDGGERRVLAERSVGSGHPTLHPSGRILTDAYLWDAVPSDDGKVPLRWIDVGSSAETVLAMVGAASGGDTKTLRLDPHPAWDRNNRLVTFNGMTGGRRNVFIADLSDQIATDGIKRSRQATGARPGPRLDDAQLYLHIGLHKTANTFLQQAVFPHWPGIDFLGKPYAKNHLEVWLRGQSAKALMSNEQFSSAPVGALLVEGKERWSEHRMHCLDRLHALFPGAGILLGVRSQAGFVLSLYSQYLRFGGTCDIDAFWTAQRSDAPLYGDDLLFMPIIERIAAEWPRLFVFALEEIAPARRSALFADMARFFGVSTRPQISADAPLNEKISREVADELLAQSRSATASMSSRELIASLRKTTERGRATGVGGHALELSAAMRSEIEAFYAEDWRATCDAIARLRASL